MPLITSIQLREPYSHSAASYSEYSHPVNAAEFQVKRQARGEDIEVRIFFPCSGALGQGVGLSLPSLEVTRAVGQALLMIAEGYLNEMTGRL